MSEELDAKIEALRGHKMTAEQRFEQRVSFVYGQQDFDKPGKTKDEIRRIVADMADYPLDELERLRAENKRLRRERGDALYMQEAYRQMLGPRGREVADMWRKQGIVRVHHSWVTDPNLLEGEAVAQIILDCESSPKTPIADVDAHTATLGEKP